MNSGAVAPATLDSLRNFARAGLLPAADVAAIVEAFTGSCEPAGPELLTAKQAAARLAVCPKTIHRLAGEGRLPRVYLRPGSKKTMRFRASDVAALLAPAPAGQ